jgi:hypothetical protein
MLSSPDPQSSQSSCRVFPAPSRDTGDLGRAIGNHLIDHRFDSAGVGYLLEAFRVDHLIGGLTLTIPQRLKNLFSRFTVNGVIQYAA